MSLGSQIRGLTGRNPKILGRARAEAPTNQVIAEFKHDPGQEPRAVTARTAAVVDFEDHSLTLSNVTTSDALAEEAFSERLPTPGEYLLLTQSFQQTSIKSRSGSISNSSRSVTEDGAQSTSGTSHAAQVSLPGIDDWELEGENLLYQADTRTRDFRRLNQWRLKLVSRQLRLRELRKVLRRQWSFISEQQGGLLQELRVLVFKGGERHVEHLLERLQEIQGLLERLQVQEEQYDMDEKLLIDEEWKVRDAEANLLHHRNVYEQGIPIQRSEKELHHAKTYNSASQTTTESISSETGTLLRQNPPSLSELQKIRARLQKLRLEHCQLLEEDGLRNELGLTLDEESSFALRVFPLRQAELLHYLDYYEEQVAERYAILDDSFDQFPTYQYTGHDLEILAQETGPGSMNDMFAMDADDTLVFQDATNEQGTHMRWESENEQGTSEMFPRFAVASENNMPGHLLLINDWLLYIIRCSSFALFQLQLFLQDVTASFEPQDFRKIVLSVWYRDGTSQWYLASVEREAQSLDPTVLSETHSKSIQPALSDPNLLMMRKGMELRVQSRSLFARSDDVRDLVDNFEGLGIAS